MAPYTPVLEEEGQIHVGPCTNLKCCTGPAQVLRRNLRKADISKLERFIRDLRGECEGMIGNASLERLVDRLHCGGITYSSLSEYVRGNKRGFRSFSEAEARKLRRRIGRDVISEDFLYVILERYQNVYQNVGDYREMVKKEEPSTLEFDLQPNVAAAFVEEANATVGENDGFVVEQVALDAAREAENTALEGEAKLAKPSVEVERPAGDKEDLTLAISAEGCFQCILCGYLVLASEDLNMHIGEVHLEQQLGFQVSNLFPSDCRNKCVECGEIISTEYVKKEHIVVKHPWDQLLQMATTGKAHSGEELEGKRRKVESQNPDLSTKRKLNEQADEKVEKLLAASTASTGRAECGQCGYTKKGIFGLRRHIAKHVDGLQYYCLHCDKIYHTKNTLGFHMFDKHRDVSSKVAGSEFSASSVPGKPAPSSPPSSGASVAPAGPLTLISVELASYLRENGLQDFLLKYNVKGNVFLIFDI